LTQYYPKHRLQALPSSAVSTTGKPEVQLKYDATLVQKWQDDGYVVLPQFYSEADTDAAKAAVAHAWTDRPSRVVVDDLDTDQRMKIGDVGEEARHRHRFKVNDLFLEYESIRWLALNARITPILKALLADTPVLCNSLNFLQGSAQGDHVDALYMTPRSQGHLIAIWVALEDCHLDAGPLRYYPGSHKIEQYVFSTGSNHFVPEEMPLWSRYMEGEVRRLGLTAQTFAARRGDVFIWSAHLLHGGSPIESPGKSRNSMVFHYFSEHDCRAIGSRIVPKAGGYWMHRMHQPVPGKDELEGPRLSARSALLSNLLLRLYQYKQGVRNSPDNRK
jgi:ectoine hydroxylase-related dioxygenase (phytanoyl-CoA dioxygenase family)